MTERTGNPYHDFKSFRREYATTYNGGSVDFWECPLCGALCSTKGIYTHVDYHLARKEEIPTL